MFERYLPQNHSEVLQLQPHLAWYDCQLMVANVQTLGRYCCKTDITEALYYCGSVTLRISSYGNIIL